MKKLRQLLLICFGLFLQECVAGPLGDTVPEDLPVFQTSKLHSKILGEDREIIVCLPRTYQQSKIKYPVVYVFDGESLFLSTVAAVDFMNNSNHFPLMPEAIIVGIKNTNRMRDMPRPQEMIGSKGASNFLSFLTSEVVPYIEGKFRTNKLNVLVGHSQGGLFVTYAGIQQPDLFPVVLSLDAPMQVNPQLERDYGNALASCKIRYFSAETAFGWGDSFAALKCDKANQIRIENESHESMAYKGIYEGFKYLFRDHLSTQKDFSLKAIVDYYERQSASFGHDYAVPAGMLLHAAVEKINTSDKQAATEILEYYNRLYGADQNYQALTSRVLTIKSAPDKKLDFYLNHPKPTPEMLRPFQGRWAGVLKGDPSTSGSMDVHVTWEIKSEKGEYVRVERVMDQFDVRSSFLFVTEENKLVWGRKHDGGGVYLSTAELSADGKFLSGHEEIIGYEFPKGVAPYRAEFSFKKAE